MHDDDILCEPEGGTFKTLHQAPAWWGAEFTMRFGGG